MYFLKQLAITFVYGLLVLLMIALIVAMGFAVQFISTYFPMTILVLVFIVAILILGLGYRLIYLDEFF